MAEKKNIIDHKHVRKIVGSFSWADHRLITGGFLDDLPAEAILLYFFLTAVSDRYGVSFYHDDRICRILKIDLHSLGQVRVDLITRGLIAYRYPVYQVLALPEKPIAPPTAQQLAEEKKKMGLYYIQKIKDVVSQRGQGAHYVKAGYRGVPFMDDRDRLLPKYLEKDRENFRIFSFVRTKAKDTHAFCFYSFYPQRL